MKNNISTENRKDYPHQGQFTFVPITEQEIQLIYNSRLLVNQRLLIQSNSDVEHYVDFCYLSGHIQFVSGCISSDEYPTLFLNGWYRVASSLEFSVISIS